MNSALDNLCGPGKALRQEPPDAAEYEGLKNSGLASLAALRRLGYRAANRYIVFQVLPHTLGLGPEVWRVLAKCHDMRNRGEYEGLLGVSERILTDLIVAARAVAEKLNTLPAAVP